MNYEANCSPMPLGFKGNTMATSLTRELKRTGDALRLALEQRGDNPAIQIQLMHDFANASGKAFESKSHNLVALAADQLKACSRGILRTLDSEGAQGVFAMAMELFPIGCDYLVEALESLTLRNPSENTQYLVGAIFRNLTAHETLFNEQLRGSETAKILEHGLRLSAGSTQDEFDAGAITDFMRSLFEFSCDAMETFERTQRSLDHLSKGCIESSVLMIDWVRSNEEFISRCVVQNGVSDYNTERLINLVASDFKLPEIAAALAFRAKHPSFENLRFAYERGMRADMAFRCGVIPDKSSAPMSQSTFKALIAYSMVFEDVMPKTINIDPNANGLKALRDACELLNQPEHKSLARDGDIQNIVDQVINAAPPRYSMEPLVGTWAERFAINNLTYRARLFTQELGV